MAEERIEEKPEVTHDPTFDIDIVDEEPQEEAPQTAPETPAEPPPAPEEPPEPPDWYRAIVAPPPYVPPAYQPPPYQAPPAYDVSAPQREKLSWDQLVDNPDKLYEIADRAAQSAAAAAREEALKVRQENMQFRYQQALNAYGGQVNKAMESFQKTVAKDPRYSNKTFKAAANDFMYQLANYARAQVEYAVQNNRPIPDVSQTLSEDMIDLCMYTAGKQAKIPANMQSVKYEGVATGTPKQAPQRKSTRQKSAEERRIQERLGLTDEQWEANEKESEELGL